MRNKNWTREELEYLEEAWGTKSVSTIATHLDRSEGAVKKKAHLLDLGPFIMAGDYVVLRTVCIELYGYYTGYLMRRLEKEGCPYFLKKINSKSVRVVNLQDFWKWAYHHRDKINFYKLEENALGQEPEWVKQERRKGYYKPRRNEWSKDEINKIGRMVRCGKNLEEIARAMKRSTSAVRHRLIVENLGQPVKVVNERWTYIDAQKVAELVMTHSLSEIAEEVNRTERSVEGFLTRATGSMSIDKVRKIYSENKEVFADAARRSEARAPRVKKTDKGPVELCIHS